MAEPALWFVRVWASHGGTASWAVPFCSLANHKENSFFMKKALRKWAQSWWPSFPALISDHGYLANYVSTICCSFTAATCYIHLGYSTQLQGTSISRIFNYHPRRSFSRVIKVPWDDGNNLKGQGLIDIFEGEMHCFSPATLAYYFRLHTLLDCNICIQIIM